MVANPVKFLPSLSLLNDCFVMLEKPLPCKFYAFMLGTKPAYPGIELFFGYTDAWMNKHKIYWTMKFSIWRFIHVILVPCIEIWIINRAGSEIITCIPVEVITLGHLKTPTCLRTHKLQINYTFIYFLNFYQSLFYYFN